MTTREAEKMVREAFERYHGVNLTQYYAIANPLPGGEVRIDTYACRLDGRTRKPLVKCVERCYSNRRTIDVRDIYRSSMSGFQVDFSDMTKYCRHYAETYYLPESLAKSPVGTWDAMEYTGMRTGFLIHAPILNDFTGTKYEHCCLERMMIHPMHFFECYKISESVEFLAKVGLFRFITPSFVRRLKSDKATFSFFRQNMDKIKHSDIGINAVIRAVANRCSLDEAVERIKASEAFKDKRYCCNDNIPEGIDRYEVYKWCKKNGVDTHEYRRYAGYIARIGENLAAYGVTYPRDFKAALESAELDAHRIDEIERRREARARRQHERIERMDESERQAWDKKETCRIRDAIASTAKKLAKINGMAGYGYAVVVPKSVKMLIDEGNAMKNCIGKMGYDKKIADGQSLIFFLRGQDGKKDVDVEVKIYSLGKNVKLEVVQCYNPCNQSASAEAQVFAREIAENAKRILFKKAARHNEIANHGIAGHLCASF